MPARTGHHGQQGQATHTHTMESAVVADLRYTLLGSDTNTLAFCSQTPSIGSANALSVNITFDASLLTDAQLQYLSEFAQLALVAKKLLQHQQVATTTSPTLAAFHASVYSTVLHFHGFINNTYIESPISTFLSLKCHLIDWTATLTHVYRMHLKSATLSPNQFLSLLHEYSLYTDKTIQSVSKLYYDSMLSLYLDITFSWMLQGILSDDSVHENFFVLQNTQDNTYSFESSNVPSFITNNVAEQIFHTGYSIYYLKNILNDKSWCNQIYNEYSQMNQLDANTIFSLYNKVLSHLNELILTDFKAEVSNLNNFLLFKSGDLLNAIIINGSSILNQPSTTLGSNQLIKILQDSIDSSSISTNSQPTIYNRIDARLLNLNSPEASAWDLFTLDFKLLPQIDYLIHSNYKEYLKVFNFLFKFVHLKHKLSNSWKVSSTLKMLPALQSRKLQIYKRKFDLIKHQFISFINTIFSFICSSILETAFTSFTDSFTTQPLIQNNKLSASREQKPLNLHDLKNIHNEYTKKISKSTLFLNPINSALYQLLRTIDTFTHLHNEFHAAVIDLDRGMRSWSGRNVDQLFAILSGDVVNGFEIGMKDFVGVLKGSGVVELQGLAVMLEN